MICIILNASTREVIFELKTKEYSTFAQSLYPVFDRFEIPTKPLTDFVNAYPQRHITIDGNMSRYEAILI